uniref:Uncharacterized protein n=1 Tax=Strigamia maritima TaxID=126957 RepID=T1J6K8_STRMM
MDVDANIASKCCRDRPNIVNLKHCGTAMPIHVQNNSIGLQNSAPESFHVKFWAAVLQLVKALRLRAPPPFVVGKREKIKIIDGLRFHELDNTNALHMRSVHKTLHMRIVLQFEACAASILIFIGSLRKKNHIIYTLFIISCEKLPLVNNLIVSKQYLQPKADGAPVFKQHSTGLAVIGDVVIISDTCLTGESTRDPTGSHGIGDPDFNDFLWNFNDFVWNFNMKDNNYIFATSGGLPSMMKICGFIVSFILSMSYFFLYLCILLTKLPIPLPYFCPKLIRPFHLHPFATI